MNIGIIIHSQSGHTLNFARAISNKLTEKGHNTEIKMLRTSGVVAPRSRKFQLRNPPSAAEFDAVLVGGPVWAFRASPVIMAYLAQATDLKNKRALSFVTEAFPFPQLGGNQAINAMNEDLAASGADILPGEILPYFFRPNKEKMAAAVERICAALEDQTKV